MKKYQCGTLPPILGNPISTDYTIETHYIKLNNKGRADVEEGGLLVLKPPKTGESLIPYVAKIAAADVAKCCKIYGVLVALPINGGTLVSVLTRGDVACVIDTTIFANIEVGECLPCKGAPNCCYENVIVKNKIDTYSRARNKVIENHIVSFG